MAALAMAAKKAEELAKLQAEEERRQAMEETERLAAKVPNVPARNSPPCQRLISP